MGWYRVIKTIKGYRYIYEQRTFRDGKHVRTQSRYIGPAGDAGSAAPVNTTSASGFKTAIVDEVLTDLMRPYPPQHVWTHGWAAVPKEESALARVRSVDEFLTRLNLKQTAETDAAYYSHGRDTINIPPEQCFFPVDAETATQAYYATIFHELGHWTGHASRLNRSKTFFRRETYSREELVAEATAIILMRHFKIAPEILTRHANYFQTWLSRTENREAALSFARQEVERVVRFLVGVNTTKAGQPAGEGVEPGHDKHS